MNAVMQFLPQTKMQLIGFTIWVVCHSLVDMYLGRRASKSDPEQHVAGSLIELICSWLKNKILGR